MATLENREPKDTFKDLLQVSNSNAGVDGTLRPVEDGEGTQSALSLSTGHARVAGNFDITGGGTFTSTGIDDNATANAITISTDEEVTLPSQPSFLLFATAMANVATGSDVTILWGTETFDIGANFASNTFTAPVTGKYQFNIVLTFNNWDSVATTTLLKLVTSNNTLRSTFDPSRFSADVSEWSLTLSALVDMDAADTAHVTINFAAGTAQADVTTASHFSGILVG